MTGSGLKNAPELASRLALARIADLLLIDVPDALEQVIMAERPPGASVRTVAARALRSVKQRYGGVVLWREDRVGSRSVLDATIKRLEPGGILWVVIANRKVVGPKTPAARRLDRGDLGRALEPAGFVAEGEVRVSAWHTALRFRRSG